MVDETTERITILLQARDRDFQRTLERNNRAIAKLARDAEKNTSRMSKQVSANLAQAAGAAASFGGGLIKGIGAGLIGAALASVSSDIRAVIGDIADLRDQAERLGVDVESLQGLQRGFKLAGVEAQVFATGMEKFLENVGDAAVGSTAFGRILQENGIALKNTDGSIRATTDILGDFSDLLSRTPDEAARIALVSEAFGRGGKAIVLALGGGSAALRQMITDAQEGGYVLDKTIIAKAAELDDKFDDLTLKIGNFFKTLVVDAAEGAAALSLLTPAALLYDAESSASALAGGFEPLGFALQDSRAQAEALAYAMQQLSRDLEFVGNGDAAASFAALGNELIGLVADFDAGTVNAETFGATLDSIGTAASGAVTEIGAIDGVSFAGVIGRLGGLFNALKSVASTAAAAAASIPGSAGGMEADIRGRVIAPSRLAPSSSPRPQQQGVDTLGNFFDARNGGGGGGGRGNSFAERAAALREETALLEAQAAAYLEAAGSGDRYAGAIEYARKRAELLTEAQRAGMEITPELSAQIDALAMAYTVAGESALAAADQLREMEAAAERGAQAITDIFFSALDGANSAKKAIASLLLEIAKVQFKNAILQAGSGSGVLGFIGGLLGGKRAGGGGVQSGTPYLVNENTPGSEVFVPSRSGGILNVPQAQSALRDAATAGGSAMSVTIGFDSSAGGFTAFVRDQAGKVVASAAPGMVRQAVQSTYAANREHRFE